MEKIGIDTKKKNRTQKIPESLVYEVINGKAVYYKNYKEVINQKKTWKK